MANDKARSVLRPATKGNHCPVCDGDHKCSFTPDGDFVLCGRRDGPVKGFVHLGAADDPTWHMYKPEGLKDIGEYRKAARKAARPAVDWEAEAAYFAKRLTPDREADLAARVGLPTAAVARVSQVGWDPDRGVWTIPERDGAGRVVGLSTRSPTGAKGMKGGSARGLVLVGGWADAPGPVFVVEGFSDACALAHCGLSVVGRPSSRGGEDHLAGLLADLPEGRPVVVCGENDRKPDGTWPGLDGADSLGQRLAGRLKGRQVLAALPPDGYKDMREWVCDQAAGWGEADHWVEAGQELAAAVMAKSRAVRPAGYHRPDVGVGRWPVPVSIGDLVAGGGGGGDWPWVWDGYLARGCVTLLSALPKAGKTTLIGHLLAALPAGGSFCGRALAAGSALVVSEESQEVWRVRGAGLGMSGDRLRVLTRPWFARPAAADWVQFCHSLADYLAGWPADLVVFDTLADLWPVRDENSPTEVTDALQPVTRLADGRAVLCVHHLRKSDGDEGTGSRGSGAILGKVDIAVELRRAAKTGHGGNANRRVLTARGRPDDVPLEWVVDFDPAAGYTHAAATAADAAADRTAAREGRDADRRAALADAIRAALPAGPPGLTRAELWAALPADLRKHEVRFREVLNANHPTARWAVAGDGTRGHPYRYWRPDLSALPHTDLPD